VTDIFFSYSSVDRERVRPVRDTLVAQGFEVFWDQEVPTGIDWDPWIRQHLAKSKCAIAFWSAASVASRNVRHEATIADQQGKLIPVLLEPLTAQQFPMGLYSHQAANLGDWNGDLNHDEWCKLRREYEAKLMPPWVRQRMDEKDAELVAERARRQGAERRDKTLQAQIAKEAEAQQGLQRELDEALDEIAALKGAAEELARAQSEAEAKQAETRQALTRERDYALAEVLSVKAKLEHLMRSQSETQAREAQTQQDFSRLAQERDEAINTVAVLRTKVEEIIRSQWARSKTEARVGLLKILEGVGQAETTTTAGGGKYWQSKEVWQRAGGICAAGAFFSFVVSSAWPLLLGVVVAALIELFIHEKMKLESRERTDS
jgi:TIR domain